MASNEDERAPLLQSHDASVDQDSGRLSDAYNRENLPTAYNAEGLSNAYKQFCELIGNRPVDLPRDRNPPQESLYQRAVQHRKSQGRMYAFTSATINTLILSQVVLGAALTGLGASNSSHILITVFGALNTVIAGLVAFLKSRGQPMRARMFRDDLDRVVDEIENSATMWKGISQNIHGYDAIDTDEAVTVRSEVARLTRLYDRAVKTNTMNDPDFYGSGITMDAHNAGLRSHTGQTLLPAMPTSAASAAPPAIQEPTPGPTADPDESPATKAPSQTPPPANKDEPVKDADKPGEVKSIDQKLNGSRSAESAPTPNPAPTDPDESPATTAKPPKPKQDLEPNGGQEHTDSSASKLS